MTANKLKIAIGAGAGCGGCDVAILDTNEKILDIHALADIVFWPLALDFKESDLESYKDGEIDLAIYHGVVRTSEQEHTAKLLRAKAKRVLSFGACACFGGVPGLCNIADKSEILDTSYGNRFSTKNPEGVVPKTESVHEKHRLTLPELYDTGKPLDRVIAVDYYLPGCPPPVELIEKLIPILSEFAKSGKLPPSGTVIAGELPLCDECKREKSEKATIDRVYRVHEIIPDDKKCLLEQGLICMGPATRSGCGWRCINVNMPCRGCMGPTANIRDQGAKMISAIASLIKADQEAKVGEDALKKIVDSIEDPLGTFYRFTLPIGIINKRGGDNKNRNR